MLLLFLDSCNGVDVMMEVTDGGGGGIGESLLEMEVSISVSPPEICSSVSLSHSGQDSWSLLVMDVLDSTLDALLGEYPLSSILGVYPDSWVRGGYPAGILGNLEA